jgi:ABC-type lipoprotein release transport system permease subunit
MLRSLRHYWRINLAVVLGAAVATAVLAGAIIIGDSMRASLQRLTLDRLGDIDFALVAEGLFREELATEIETALSERGIEGRSASALILDASALHASTRALATEVTLMGIDPAFSAMFPASRSALDAGLEANSGQLFPSVVINRSLARELGAEVGDAVLVSFESTTEIPRESLLGNQAAAESLAGQRLTVTAILPDLGPGRFGLRPHQQTTYNAYVALGTLQRRLDRPGGANALFVASSGDRKAAGESLQQALLESLTLEDLGLEVEEAGGFGRLSSRRFVLRQQTVDTALRVLSAARIPAQPVLGYLANALAVGERSIPYSMIVGLSIPPADGLGSLIGVSGESIPEVAAGQVVLGSWAAEELSASVGDTLQVTYYEVGENDDLEATSAQLEIAAVARMDGLMVDGTLLPEFPGIADADDIAAWEPPFPMDLGRIGASDEQFWDQYGASPKAIVNLATAQSLWANRFGDVTTIRTLPAAVEPLAAALGRELDLAAFGMAFQPVKEQGLAAASGSTDFAGLFIGFSIFLIGSAALVVGLLFSLSVELRASEIGLRRAVGFPERRVRHRLLAEGTFLAVLGGIAGTGLAIAYAAVLIDVLADLWKPMLDLPLLVLDLRPGSIGAAVAASVLLVVLSIVIALRRLSRVPTPALLAGVTRARSTEQGRAIAGPLALVTLGLAVVAIATGVLVGARSSPALFFGAGALLIVAGFSAFAAWCRRPQGNLSRAGTGAYLRMAARNSAHSPGRSLLSVALVGCAAFMLVSVAANRRELDPRALGANSGTGGFTLVAETDVPLRGAVDHLGADHGAAAYPLRLLPGEDASCLNLYQPETPRVVGVPSSFIARGGFSFAKTVRTVDNPWTLLERELEPDVIPAIGDANSVRWILHSGLGQDIPIIDDHGETVRLRLVGLLDKSIFQSELVIAEQMFLRHFPAHGGYSYFLLEAPLGTHEEVARSLEEELAPYGFDVTRTADKLARFLGIEEMYLSTFQLLGGLGLILGTVGLGIVLVRNVNERRSELAMLRAVGFGRRSIAAMILLENLFQLLVGLVIGSTAGLLALLPHFLDASLHLPWGSLLATLATVLVVGMLSSLAGVAAALRSPLLPALKAE